MLLKKGHYLIPRQDGCTLAGSTVEDAGFDKSTTQGALDKLKKAAIGIVPQLSDCEIVNHWAGLRPRSENERPLIGNYPGIDGLYFNTGHYRNGLLLAPASARLMTDIILDRSPIIDPNPFTME